MYSTAIIFDRKRQAEGDKEGPLEVRITHARKSYYINTGMRVQQKHWAGAVVNRPDADALNNRLGIIVRRVNEKINEFIEEQRPLDIDAIKNCLYAGSVVNLEPDAMLKWIKKEIPSMNVKDGTEKHYWLMYDRLKEFGQMRTWRDLTVENIYAWDGWLHGLKARKKRNEAERGVTDATVYNYHKTLKAMLNRAIGMGVIEVSPYARLKGKFKRGSTDNIDYLTEEQMQLIVSTHPVPGTLMEAVRDLFVFQMFTGLSYSDSQVFDAKHYRKEGDVWVVTGQRIKTGVPYVSVLLPPVIDVLERHNWQTPKLPNQKYNWLLKTLGTVIGIEGLHSHLARHTFATFMLSNNAKVQNVMRMLGHTNIKQTMLYAKVLAKDIRDDFDRIENKFSF